MKTLIIASLFSTVAFAGAASAQTAAPEAGTTPPATQTEGAADAATMDDGGFLTYQEGSQLLGSGLMGADVQGSDGESIGTVDDLVLDRDGQIQAVVVGVGGFLGIGAKDVAIMNDRLEFVLAQDAAAEGAGAADSTMAPATTGDPATPAAPADTGAMGATTTAPAGSATGTSPATGTTGTMGEDTAMGGEGTGMGWSGAGIDHIQVDYTREQLENAPEFESAE